MGKQKFHKIKKALVVFLLVSLAASFTVASVSACSLEGKAQAPSEKSVCTKSITEKTKEKETAKMKYSFCDCCCNKHGGDERWYCTSGVCDSDNINCIEGGDCQMHTTAKKSKCAK